MGLVVVMVIITFSRCSAAERTTLYGIRRRYELEIAA